MKPTEISRHEVAVYKALLDAGDTWPSNKDVAQRAGVSARTARAHTLKLVRLGVLEQAAVFPGYRYRVATRDHPYVAQLSRAAEVLGIPLEPDPVPCTVCAEPATEVKDDRGTLYVHPRRVFPCRRGAGG